MARYAIILFVYTLVEGRDIKIIIKKFNMKFFFLNQSDLEAQT